LFPYPKSERKQNMSYLSMLLIECIRELVIELKTEFSLFNLIINTKQVSL
jgi:hypothetical protein